MKTYTAVLANLLFFWASISVAQSHCEDCLTPKDSTVTSSWVVGLGINIVDDSATPFGSDFIKIKETWNSVPYPSRISVGRFLKNGVGMEAIGTYNRYREGKIVDGRINTALREYYALDGKLSYDLNKLFGETGWFDPYIHAGAGYSSIGSEGRMTGNAGFGFNTWLNDKWGINLNTMGKWGLKEGATKQLQHSVAVVHRLGIKKELSAKGEEKLALIQAIENERQRVSDSLMNVKQLEEEQLALQEKLAREKEKARLAAVEKAAIDAATERRKQVQDAIDALGYVYFDLNSSYLNRESKAILDQLAKIMLETPSLRLKITSHTDSRGLNAYNDWLSDRRARRTLDYLVDHGIVPVRLICEGLGEEHLTNHCKDAVYCTEKEHRANRRSEFLMIEM